jgi:tRNA pseudouridine13 synthase
MKFTIKEQPEDFIVEEVSKEDFLDNGKFKIFILEKKNYTTQRAVSLIAQRFREDVKKIGICGTKDKFAITKQFISVDRSSKINEFEIKSETGYLKLTFVGYLNEKLYVGKLAGNKFKIKIKNIENITENVLVKNIEKIKEIGYTINYYDNQRFSSNNFEVGLAILKKDYKKACDILLNKDKLFGYEIEVKDFLEDRPTEYLNALAKCVPIPILKFFVTSVQSYFFNEMIRRFIVSKKIDFTKSEYKHGELLFADIKNLIEEKISLIGFDYEFDDEILENIAEDLLEEYELNSMNFVIRSMPSLCLVEEKRLVLSKVNDLKYKIENNTMELEFNLEKGAYATILIKNIFGEYQ